jgi:hypothetical protein
MNTWKRSKTAGLQGNGLLAACSRPVRCCSHNLRSAERKLFRAEKAFNKRVQFWGGQLPPAYFGLVQCTKRFSKNWINGS